MKLEYSLAKSYRDRVFVETGEVISAEASIELVNEALTAPMRAHLLRRGGARVPAALPLLSYSVSYDASQVGPGERIALDAPATDADALALFGADMGRWEAAEAQRAVKAAARAEERAEAQAQHAAHAERLRIAVLEEEAQREAREADKHTWITAHGSDFLKRACLAGGYDCQRRYVEERAGVEAPGYVVDFKDAAQWRDRSCPSEAALAEAERVSGLVVWLVASPDREAYDFAEREAVVIRGYLDKYDLIKEA